MEKAVAVCTIISAVIFTGSFIAFPVFLFKDYYTLVSTPDASSSFVTALTVLFFFYIAELITVFIIVILFALCRADSNCDVYFFNAYCLMLVANLFTCIVIFVDSRE